MFVGAALFTVTRYDARFTEQLQRLIEVY